MSRLRFGLAALLGVALGAIPMAEPALAANPATFGVTASLIPAVTLTSGVSLSAATVSVGQPYWVYLTVNNTSGSPASNVTGTLWVSGGSAASYGVSNPAVLASLPGGGSVTFTWTVTALAAGTEFWTGSGTGSGATSAPTSASAVVQTPPSLTSVVSVAPSAVCTGQPFDLTVTMANGGQAAATGVTVLPFTVTGTGTATYVAGPAALAVTIPGGASTTYVWTYNATVAGGIGFAMTVTGTDANSGFAVAGPRQVSPTITASTSASLYVQALVQPSVSSGQAFTVRLSVTNAGGVPATGVTGSLEINAGPGVLVSPTVTSPVSIGGGGGANVFQWTVNATGTGTITFTATASGTACGSFAVSAADGVATTSLAAPNLVSAIAVSPASVVQGQVVTVVMTVTNTGGTQMVGVIPTLNVSGPATPVPPTLLANGTPLSATGTTLAGGGAMVTFHWSFTATGDGTISFSGGVSGTDPNSGGTVSSPPATTPPPVDIKTPASISAGLVLTPLLQVQVGGTVTAKLTVVNGGESILRVTSITKVESDPGGLIGPASGFPPGLPQDIQGASSTTFTWTYNAVTCGSQPFTVSANTFGTDLGLSRTLSSGPVISNGITAATSASLMVVSVLNPNVKVAGLANITVTIYDDCSPRVAVANEVITLSVVTGGGKVVYLSGPTDATGSMRAIVLTGNVPGQNAYLVSDPNLPGTTVFVEGTVPDVPTPYLSKNFFSPKAGEKLQVRTTEPTAVHLSVRVYNLAGELVKIVKEADVQPGLTVWDWDGRNEAGVKVGNGTYFIQIVSGRNTQIKRVIVLDH